MVDGVHSEIMKDGKIIWFVVIDGSRVQGQGFNSRQTALDYFNNNKPAEKTEVESASPKPSM